MGFLLVNCANKLNHCFLKKYVDMNEIFKIPGLEVDLGYFDSVLLSVASNAMGNLSFFKIVKSVTETLFDV